MKFSRANSIALLLLFALILSSNCGRPAVLEPNPKPMIYHGGLILSNSNTLNVYIIWYGNFTAEEKSVISDFFASFLPENRGQKGQPTVSKWWQTITLYMDKEGKSVPEEVRVVKELEDAYSLGKNNLKRDQIASLVQDNVDKRVLPADRNGIYLVLTAKDVTVERFCMSSCGFHKTTLKAEKLVIAHVGDPSLQCPGFCAWPYAVPRYGPPFNPLPSPNGVGSDGMVMNLGTVLAGSSTNPFENGYFQGDFRDPVEAVSACAGKFGDGAFAGYPGLLQNDTNGKAYNLYGANGRRFLLPAMWDLRTSSCRVVF